MLGTRDYVTKNGFGDVVVGLSGGDRLVAGGHHRRRRPRPRAGARRAHAVALLERPLDHRRRGPGRQPGHRPPHHRHRARPSRPSPTCWRPSFAGRPPDLTEENLQSRIRGVTLMALSNKLGLAGAHHRQQERERGRLQHPLRRHRRRLRRHQGRAQAARLPAVPRPQRPGRARADPRDGAREAAVGRAASRPARRPEPAALRGARPDHRGLRRRTTAPPPSWSRPASTRPRSSGWSA